MTLNILYGLLLTVVFAAIIVYFYTPHRKDKVEDPKYTMLKDDDEE